jgi:predicted dehydrogenase
MSESSQNHQDVTRRDFLKGSAALSTAALTGTAAVRGAFAGETDKLRVGLVGTGNRGCIDAENCVKAQPGVELYALGDLFEEQRGRDRIMSLTSGAERLKNRLGDKFNVPKERRFTGFDAYKRVLETDVDLVLFVTPPHFRPQHIRAAVEAGKHVFMEKPVAVDPVGVRHVIESAKMAEEKGLAVMGGTQMRHAPDYIGVMDRIHRGDIGEVVAGSAYYNTGSLWLNERFDDMSEMEWQIRNWYYFNWLSGDFIVEQAIHKIDILNWAFGGPPTKCMGFGGREVRTGEEYGNIFDQFAIEYEYENGARVLNTCRQIPNSTRRMGEQIVGTKGKAISTGGFGLKLVGENPWEHEGDNEDPSVLEHRNLIESVRNNEPFHDGQRVAESTLTAIMGRMSAYTGREISWDWIYNSSELELGPNSYEWGPYEPEPVAAPGQTELI